MHISAVVADTKLHASAVIRWLGLDPNIWVPVAYGDRLKNAYDNVKIVRPLRDISESHLVWMIDVLLPRVARRRDTVPPHWEPTGSVDDETSAGYASMWA